MKYLYCGNHVIQNIFFVFLIYKDDVLKVVMVMGMVVVIPMDMVATVMGKLPFLMILTFLKKRHVNDISQI